MAVPESCHNRAARTIHQLRGLPNLHLSSCTNSSYLSVIDEHHAVAYRVFGGADVDRPSREPDTRSEGFGFDWQSPQIELQGAER